MSNAIVMAHELPTLAISVRQPWAWALIHAGKDCENRSAASLRIRDRRTDLRGAHQILDFMAN